MKKFGSISISVLLLALSITTSCKKDDLKPIELSGISIKSTPSKTDYYVTDKIDLSGLAITLNFNNGETKEVFYSEFENEGIYTIPANRALVTANMKEILITDEVTRKNVSQNISVNVVSNISIKSAPTKTGHYVGDVLDLTGLVITLSMENGHTEDVHLIDFPGKKITCIPNNRDTLKTSSKILKINYTPTNKSDSMTIMELVADIDNNSYAITKIGEQFWMAENLNTTRYANGDEIPFINDMAIWKELKNNDTANAYCYYLNGSLYGDTYGALYTWPAAMGGNVGSSPANSGGVQGVCPTGWHLPSDAEWTELTDFLGGESIGGGKLKEAGTKNWDSPNKGATNETGFTALGSGAASISWTYNRFKSYWWTSTPSSLTYAAWSRELHHDSEEVVREYRSGKSSGYSVRCVKD